MRPIVLQRKTEGEKEQRDEGKKEAIRVADRKLDREKELNSRSEEADKRNRRGSVFCPITLLEEKERPCDRRFLFPRFFAGPLLVSALLSRPHRSLVLLSIVLDCVVSS